MRVECRLDPSSLKSAADELRRYADELQERARATAVGVAKEASEAARAACPSPDVSSTIGWREAEGGATAYANGPLVSPSSGAYEVPLSHLLEFGTGIRGDVGYGAEHGYVVNMSGKGESGWFYPKKDGSFGFTHGMGARRYMASGAEEARAMLLSIARGEFSR